MSGAKLLRSFRFRIALLSTCFSGFVLVNFCVGSWFLIRQANLERLDETIRRTAMAPLSIPRMPGNWADFEKAMRFIQGDEQADAGIMFIKGRNGDVLYASPDWPQELPADLFPVPDLPEPDASLRGGPGWDRFPEPPKFWDGDARREEMNDNPHRNPRGFGHDGPPHEEPPPEGPLSDGPLGDRPPPEGPPDRRMRQEPPGGGPGDHMRPLPPPLPIKTHRFFTVSAANGEWRVGVMSNPYITFVLGRNMSRFHAEMRFLRNAFLFALPAALLLIALGGWLVSQRALRPVRTLTSTAEGITARGLDQRIPISGENEEFNRLIVVFNGMMDRLEKSFQQAVRFSADAAHELKTPLTILQGELEHALQNAPADSPEQQSYGTLLEEVQRLKAVIRKLLLLSLADSGQLKPNIEPIPLTGIVQESIEDAAILAPELTLEQELEPGISVAADGDLLRQVIQNLISNAIKYNHPQGTIRFALRRADDKVRFTISNTGPEIPPEDREKVFERFYRGDKARNRKVDGTGLGLSLAREIARAHRGDLVLENAAGNLTAFTLILPA